MACMCYSEVLPLRAHWPTLLPPVRPSSRGLLCCLGRPVSMHRVDFWFYIQWGALGCWRPLAYSELLVWMKHWPGLSGKKASPKPVSLTRASCMFEPSNGLSSQSNSKHIESRSSFQSLAWILTGLCSVVSASLLCTFPLMDYKIHLLLGKLSIMLKTHFKKKATP